MGTIITNIKKFFQVNTTAKIIAIIISVSCFIYYLSSNHSIFISLVSSVFIWFICYGIYRLCSRKKLASFTKHEHTVREERGSIKADPAVDIRCISKIDSMDGHDFEYFIANLLKKLGYLNVTVTQGSGDQGVDVLAEMGGAKYAIQCKHYSSPLGNTPVQEVAAGKDFYNCHIGVVVTNNYFTRGGKELAEKVKVLLWNRDTLIAMIEKAYPNENLGELQELVR